MKALWTPIEHTTIRKAEIGTIVALTGRDLHQVFGLMVHFWMWAETMTQDGTINTPVKALPVLIGADVEFWQAVIQSGWLEESNGGIVVPRADHWLTSGAKSRLLKNRRQSQWRDGRVDGDVDTQPSTAASTTGTGQEQNRIPDPVPGSCSSPETSESPKRIRGLKPDSVFRRMTLEALSDLAKLREWFDFQSTSPDPIGPQSVQEWKFCIAAAYQAREDGKRNKLGYFTTLFSKKRGDITQKSLAIAEKAIQEAA